MRAGILAAVEKLRTVETRDCFEADLLDAVCAELERLATPPSTPSRTVPGVEVVREPAPGESIIITPMLGGPGYQCSTNLGAPLAACASVARLVKWVHGYPNTCAHAYNLRDLE